MEKNSIRKNIKEYVMMILGTLLMSAGVYFFKIPNNLVTGGVSGIGTMLGGLFPVFSVSVWIAILNMLLLLIGFIFLGKATGIRTVICSLLFSFFNYMFEVIVPMDGPFTNQPLLELIYAMTLTSAGAAVVFNNNASAGGTDIVALIIKKYISINVGKALLIADFIVASMSFATFGMQAGMFSMLGLFAKAFLVDVIIDSINSCKYFIAITTKPEEITKYILEDLHHGATVSEAEGSYTGEKRYMIHTVCKRVEAIRLRQKIKNADPGSFVIITTTSEIIGRGFRGV